MGDISTVDPVTGLPSYYSSFGGPLHGINAGPLPLQQAKEQGAARSLQVSQQSSAAARQQQQSGLTMLEQEAGLDGAGAKAAIGGGLQSLQRVGTTLLIVAGLIGLALAALLIWPAVVAIKQSKALSRYDSGQTSEAAKPSIGAAKTMAILTAILGGLGLLAGIVGLVGGQSVSAFGGIFAIAMLTVGAIAFHRLTKKSETEVASDKKRGAWSHAASGLWIAAIVLGLLLPALGAIVAGAVLASL